MTARKPTTVVFDVGNVLLRWDPRHLYRTIFDDEAEMEWFLSDVCTPDWNLEQDRGRDWDEAVALLAKDHPAHEDPIRAFHDRWEETVSGSDRRECRAARAPARSGRAELLHHQLLGAEIRAVAGALSVPHRLRRHHRVGRRAASETPARDLQSAPEALRPEAGRLHLHRRFASQRGRGAGGRHARHPFSSSRWIWRPNCAATAFAPE